MSSIYKRKRNGKFDGYVMYSTYAFDPIKNKKRYFNITIGKLGPTLSWNDCIKKKKDLDRSFQNQKQNKKEMILNQAIKTYIEFKKNKNSKISAASIKILSYHLNKFQKILNKRYGMGIKTKHIELKMLAWYFALRQSQLKESSLEVHRRIIFSFLGWTKDS